MEVGGGIFDIVPVVEVTYVNLLTILAAFKSLHDFAHSFPIF